MTRISIADAFQAGADYQLEACCKALEDYCDCGVELVDSRVRELLHELCRPKPSTDPLEPSDTDSRLSPAQLGDFSAELGDPWPVIERLRMALREAERWCAGDTNITAHCIIDLIDRLPKKHTENAQ